MTATRSTERALIVALVALVAAIAVVLLSRGSSSGSPATSAGSPGGLTAWTLPGHLRAANFSLPDQDGRRVTLSSYRGQVVVLTFMHSLCRGACPLMAEEIKGALNDLPHLGRPVPAIAVSVDPKQDTPGNRRKFLAKYQMTGRLEYLNGSLQALEVIWHHYAIAPETSSKETHSAYVMLIDKRGYWRVGIPVSGLTPEELAHDIGVLEREPA